MAAREVHIPLVKVFTQSYRAWKAGKRLIANRGGTRSGKTYSLMELLILIAASTQKNIDIVSETLPHLKRGAIDNFETITDDWGFVEGTHFDRNRTDNIIEFKQSKGRIRFFSADNWTKVKGPGRDILFINEANNIPYEVYRQLAVRTTETIFIDWNPDSEFWFEERQLDVKDTTTEIVSTYKDNPFLSQVQIDEIESNQYDAEWWKVYGLGQKGRAQGIIYNNWDQCADIPKEARLLGYGLDFGYMNDPTAIVAIYTLQGELYLNELLYKKGLTNPEIAEFLKRYPSAPIVADSAEMKSIQELRNLGIRFVEPCVKGNDSVRNGIQMVKQYKLHVTKESLDIIYELRHYKWLEDKITGELANEPNKNAHVDHSLDAIRYFVSLKLQPRRLGTARATIIRN